MLPQCQALEAAVADAAISAALTQRRAFRFPRGYLMREKSVHGFQTGDHVRAEVPSGVKAGTHQGRDR